jgi:hypothetical protein
MAAIDYSTPSTTLHFGEAVRITGADRLRRNSLTAVLITRKNTEAISGDVEAYSLTTPLEPFSSPAHLVEIPSR